MSYSFGNSWLEIFFTTCPQAVLDYNKSVAPTYEFHDTIELKINFLRPVLTKALYKCRDFSNFDKNNFDEHINKVISESTLPTSVDDLCSFFTQTLSSALDIFAPNRTISTSTHKKPWVNAEIRKLMDSREKMYRQARAAKSEKRFNEYKELRRIVSNRIDSENNALVSINIYLSTLNNFGPLFVDLDLLQLNNLHLLNIFLQLPSTIILH